MADNTIFNLKIKPYLDNLLNINYLNIFNKLFNPIYFGKSKLIFWFIFNIILFINFYFGFTKKDDDKDINDKSYIFITSFNIVFYVLYLFFIHSMNIKMSCGKHVSLSEIINKESFKQSFNLYKSYFNNDKNELYKLIRNYKCFKKNGLPLKGNELNNDFFIFSNVEKIKNLNTDFNKNLDYIKNNVQPNNKYISINIYLILISILQSSILYSSNETFEQTIISIILVLIFFIWTCVVNLPIWILILFIIVTILIYITKGAYDVYQQFKNKPTKKYDDDFLCKPHIIPIVNDKWAPRNFSENINYCINKKSNSFFLKLMKPYFDVINKIETEVTDQKSKLNNLSGVVSMFEDKIKNLADDVYNKIQTILDKIQQIRSKIYDIFKNIFDIFKAIIISIINVMYAISTIDKIINEIPFVCFDENTLINMNNNTNLEIKNIKVGDKLENNVEVLGVIKSKYMHQDIYLYNNVIVTGDHFVYDNNEHKKICDCNNSILIKNYQKEYLYCLITSNQKITINNTIFSDYFDIDNINIQYNIQNDILNKLNNNLNYQYIDNSNDLPIWCFHEDTNILLHNKIIKKIKDIQINELTKTGLVYSIQKIKVNRNNIYNYKDIITTGHQIVFENNKWLRVKDSNISFKTDLINNNIFYNITTSTNRININNIEFTDFEQYNNYGYEQYLFKNKIN